VTCLQVTSSQGTYDVRIGEGLLTDLGAHLRAVSAAQRVLVVVDEAVAHSHGEMAIESLRAAGCTVSSVAVAAQEANKSIDTMGRLWDAALAASLDRRDAIVAVGGGLTGDVGGFLAATWLRGIDLVQVPTTLLAMVDASIGGKTGVNAPLPESVGGGLGKNLIGAFWPPKLVLTDPQVLRTLPMEELRCGLAECVKHAVLSDGSLMSELEADGPALAEGHTDHAGEIVQRSAAIKVQIVELDEREAGSRALLNLGHTFAHAIEGYPDLGLKHGQAVAIGLVAAAQTGVAMGCYDASEQDRLTQLLTALQLPLTLPMNTLAASAETLMERMQFDKKTVHGTLRLVVPVHGGGAEVRDDVDTAVVRHAWRAVGAS
jgi:3-dehydroquinate synthase